jgi:hypothetical protein
VLKFVAAHHAGSDFERMLGLVEDVTGFIQERVSGRAAVHV